jgi:hypothetical protein
MKKFTSTIIPFVENEIHKIPAAAIVLLTPKLTFSEDIYFKYN